MKSKGILSLVATPIGNLEDISKRALLELESADYIAAEDTRRTIKLLNRYEIKKPLESYHEHNKREKGSKIINDLLEGKKVALVSDAGCPGISDPGEDLVKLAYENDITVTMIPGPAAFVMAVVLSGLPSEKFIFEGFLPMNNKDKKEVLQELSSSSRTVIFYEAPHRIKKTLKDLYEIFGDRKIAIARELTKIHEEIIRCSISESIDIFTEREARGEFVLVVEGRNKEDIIKEEIEKWEALTIQQHMLIYQNKGLEKKEAMKKVAKERGVTKREIYEFLIKEGNEK